MCVCVNRNSRGFFRGDRNRLFLARPRTRAPATFASPLPQPATVYSITARNSLNFPLVSDYRPGVSTTVTQIRYNIDLRGVHNRYMRGRRSVVAFLPPSTRDTYRDVTLSKRNRIGVLQSRIKGMAAMAYGRRELGFLKARGFLNYSKIFCNENTRETL